MIDFKISDDGDIVVTNRKELPRLRLGFHVSDSPVFKMSFVQGMESPHDNKYDFCLQFETLNNDVMSPAIFKSCTNQEADKQRIMTRLRTELGELRLMPQEGTNLYQIKHEALTSPDTLASIESIVKNGIESILTGEIKVVASPEKVEGPFYCQNVMIYIFENEKLVYTFSF